MSPATDVRGLPPLTDAEREAIVARVRSVPLARTLPIEIVSVERGECTFRLKRDPAYDGIFESLHGGILMTLADSAAAFAILTLTDPSESVTTTEMNIRFFAPVLDGVTAHARVIKLGRTLAPVLVDLTDDRGKLVAHAGVTYMRLGSPAPRPARKGGVAT
jgi:uncharacterized protein (TIGR00369 family)